MNILREPLAIHDRGETQGQLERVRALMQDVGLDTRFLNRYPHSFSGGQRQRIGIARALALDPDLIICDEPVSALDVSVQAQILNLLLDIHAREGLAMLFISHDLAVVRHIADRVVVVLDGHVVEAGSVEDVVDRPQAEYTQRLLAAAEARA